MFFYLVLVVVAALAFWLYGYKPFETAVHHHEDNSAIKKRKKKKRSHNKNKAQRQDAQESEEDQPEQPTEPAAVASVPQVPVPNSTEQPPSPNQVPQPKLKVLRVVGSQAKQQAKPFITPSPSDSPQLTKKQRENARRKERMDVVKEQQRLEQEQRLKQHKRELIKTRINEFDQKLLKQQLKHRNSGASSASVESTDDFKRIW